MEVGYLKLQPSVEKSLDAANTSVRATSTPGAFEMTGDQNDG
jgi:hypothetical protein